MRLAPRSLQARLLAAVLGLVAAVWLAMAVWTWFDVRHELGELLDAHLAQAAALLLAQQGHELEEGHAGLDAPSLHRYAPRVAFQMFHEGRLLLRSAGAPLQPMAPPVPGFADIAVDGQPWRVFVSPPSTQGAQVYVAEQQASRGSILRAVLRSLLLPMALALPLLGLAAWAAVRHGLAPLRSLGRLLAARQPDALQPLQVDDAPTEMQPLLDALNGLFGRIEQLMANERRFTADAAHELRTPLAALRAQAQVALNESDDARRQHALQATLHGCDRATRLVEQLLQLSRLDSGARIARQVLDFGALVRGVAAEQAGAALRKGQQLALELPQDTSDLQVQGDPTLLAMLVRNLLDNAIRYSPGGATVRLQVQREGTQVQLAVEDSGPGVDAAALQRLGERFFRVLGNGGEGSGLGWSIVRRIAAAHEATVQVARSRSLGGLQVRLQFGAAAAG